MSAIDPNSRLSKLIKLQILANNRNLFVEVGFRWFVDETNLVLVKRQISIQTSVPWVYNPNNPDIEKIPPPYVSPVNSATDTNDNLSKAIPYIIAFLLLFFLFKLTANQ